MIEQKEIIPFLSSLSLCEGMTKKQICEIGEKCTIREFVKKSIVFLEEDRGTVFYVIYSGRIKITKLNQEGNEIILAILGPGDFFGEMSMIDNQPRNANAFTLDSAVLIVFSRNEFYSITDANPVFSNNLLKTFAARLRMTDKLVKSLFMDTARRRVLYTLFNLAVQFGEKRDEKTYIIDELPNQTDLGSFSGTSRETLSRIMKKFEQNGIIKRENKNTLILNYEKYKERMLDDD